MKAHNIGANPTFASGCPDPLGQAVSQLLFSDAATRVIFHR
jgi:hypothetical protein